MLYEKVSKRTPQQAGQALEAAAQKHKFGVLTIHDLKQTMANKGPNFKWSRKRERKQFYVREESAPQGGSDPSPLSDRDTGTFGLSRRSSPVQLVQVPKGHANLREHVEFHPCSRELLYFLGIQKKLLPMPFFFQDYSVGALGRAGRKDAADHIPVAPIDQQFLD